MQEKKQKKIKASRTPAKEVGYPTFFADRRLLFLSQ